MVSAWCVTAAILLGTHMRSTDASSIGPSACWNIGDPIGCDPRNFSNPSNPLTCKEKTIMNWAGKPAYTNAFELKGPTGKTSYEPEEWITLVLRVKIYSLKYRGLIILATADDGTMVGEWKSAVDVGKSRMFWAPHKKCIMHAHADPKPLKMTFRYKAPPVGTGRITFKAMIKVGPANDGYFYYPNGVEKIIGPQIPTGGFPGAHIPFQLTEGPVAPTSWVMGDFSESCFE
ncbi:hypothetical protein AAMO2058_000759700, partial [Amorphochlora amoebiformis]